MSQERRSLYRILHVQPEAPAEVITAAYRCLMTKLRHHPDLGGDHATAVRINEAYRVLSDTARRRAYDQARRQRHGGAAVRAAQEPAATRGCPFCQAPLPRSIAPDTRCARCGSPLAALAHQMGATRELFGRRGATRFQKSLPATLHTSPDAAPLAAKLRDLSLTGLSLYVTAALRNGTIVRVTAPGIDVVAHVVQARARERLHLVHARTLTACFARAGGVFVSATA